MTGEHDYTGDEEIDAVIREITSRLAEPLRTRVREETIWRISDVFGPCCWPSDPSVALPPNLLEEHDSPEDVVAHEVGHAVHGLEGYGVERRYPDGEDDLEGVKRGDVAAGRLDPVEKRDGRNVHVVSAVQAANERYVGAQGALHAGYTPGDRVPRPYAAASAGEMFAELFRVAVRGGDVEVPASFEYLLDD